jgi:hypothetical protein
MNFGEKIVTATLGLAFTVTLNHTEEYRMARAIRDGSYFASPVPEEKIDESLLPVPLQLMQQKVASESTFCGMVGPKGVGKSYALDKLGYTLPNVVKLHISAVKPCDLSDLLVSHLKGKIFVAPFPWNRLRLTNYESTVTIQNVFNKVHRETKSPVTVLIDMDAATVSGPVSANVPGFLGGSYASVKTTPADILPLALSVDKFTRDAKKLSADMRLMQLFFIASEGLLFQYQAQREPRLCLFLTSELSVAASKSYLKQYYNVDVVDDGHLRRSSARKGKWALPSSLL